MRHEPTDTACEEMGLLIQAEIDGELDAGGSARLAAHLAGCAGCTATQDRLAALSATLRRDLAHHAAPASLRATIQRRLAAAQPAPHAAARPPGLLALLRQRGWAAVPFAGGAVVTALMLLAMLPRPADFAETIVSDHIRALQPGHLVDVMSTDQHTVKPWFDGRLDFAPPVKDWAAQGFPLVGGRLDYIDGHEAAALVYRRAAHVIDVSVWPDHSGNTAPPVSGTRNGYNFVHWAQNGMRFWAVSDLEAAQLDDFVRLWRGGS